MYPTLDVPIGSICAYAGNLSPVSTKQNQVWENTDCAGTPSTPASGANPIVFIEAFGWMVCDGRTLEIKKYSRLYGALGNLYGGSYNEGTFCIPDYRGLFLRGVDSGAGLDPDSSTRIGPTGQGKSAGVGSIQCDAFQTHKHQYQAVEISGLSGSGNAAGIPPSSQQPTTTPISPPARTADETRSRNVAVYYIIRFR